MSGGRQPLSLKFRWRSAACSRYRPSVTPCGLLLSSSRQVASDQPRCARPGCTDSPVADSRTGHNNGSRTARREPAMTRSPDSYDAAVSPCSTRIPLALPFTMTAGGRSWLGSRRESPDDPTNHRASHQGWKLESYRRLCLSQGQPNCSWPTRPSETGVCALSAHRSWAHRYAIGGRFATHGGRYRSCIPPRRERPTRREPAERTLGVSAAETTRTSTRCQRSGRWGVISPDS